MHAWANASFCVNLHACGLIEVQRLGQAVQGSQHQCYTLTLNPNPNPNKLHLFCVLAVHEVISLGFSRKGSFDDAWRCWLACPVLALQPWGMLAGSVGQWRCSCSVAIFAAVCHSQAGAAQQTKARLQFRPPSQIQEGLAKAF